MLVIRLFRIGKKNQPSFKIVVTDKRKSSTRGRSVEEVGFLNPRTKERALKKERIKYWLSVGAQPSSTVFNLLVSEKIIEGKKKIDVHKKPKKVEEKPGEAPAAPVAPAAAATAAAVPAPAAPAKEEKPAEEKPKEEPKTEKPAETKPKEKEEG